jgi:hypothetical protein
MTLELLIQSLTKRLNEDSRLVDELQMMDFFEMYKEEMSCQVLVGVFDKVQCEESLFDLLEPLCVIPPEHATETPVEVEAEPDAEAETDATAIFDIEPDREPDLFDNPEEYVGVNDEGMYGSVPPAPQFAQPTNNANSNENVEEMLNL